ncbi:MAG: nucleotide exchange factor GrpE [Nitrosomonadales bacterium]|nr:nucleotide exchange factor GrpE [Nitrosomonadales bacterium]
MSLDPDEKERLVEEFRAFMETCEESDEGGDNVIDLHTLLAEMAVLKNEIRLESRQFKSMLEEMRNFGDALREQNERLNRDLDLAREQVAAVRQKAERGLLLDMLDLRDRLQAGADVAATHRPSFFARLAPGETRFAGSLGQGLTLTLQRLDDALAGYRVRPLEVIGQPLDPRTMRAVGAETVAGKPDGAVLREARRGFFHGGELLRAAEVIVNKKG